MSTQSGSLKSYLKKDVSDPLLKYFYAVATLACSLVASEQNVHKWMCAQLTQFLLLQCWPEAVPGTAAAAPTVKPTPRRHKNCLDNCQVLDTCEWRQVLVFMEWALKTRFRSGKSRKGWKIRNGQWEEDEHGWMVAQLLLLHCHFHLHYGVLVRPFNCSTRFV